MVIEPGVEVNPVVHTTAPKTHTRNVQLRQERDADTQIGSGMLLGQATGRRQRQAGLVHVNLAIGARTRCAGTAQAEELAQGSCACCRGV